GAIALKQRFELEQFQQSERELLALKSDLRKTLIELALAEQKRKQGADLPVPPAVLEEAVRTHPELRSREERKSRLQDEIRAALRDGMGRGHPQVRAKQQEIAEIESALASQAKD